MFKKLLITLLHQIHAMYKTTTNANNSARCYKAKLCIASSSVLLTVKPWHDVIGRIADLLIMRLYSCVHLLIPGVYFLLKAIKVCADTKAMVWYHESE